MVGGGLRRVLARRVAETAPPPYYLGVAFFDAWLLGIYVSAAPTASTDAPSTRGRRAPSGVVRARRPLRRRAGAWSFLSDAFLLGFFACRPRRRRRRDASCGFGGLCFCKKRQSLSSQCSRCWSKSIVATLTLSLHRLTNAKNTADQPCAIAAAETAAHPRRKNSPREEGRPP